MYVVPLYLKFIVNKPTGLMSDILELLLLLFWIDINVGKWSPENEMDFLNNVRGLHWNLGGRFSSFNFVNEDLDKRSSVAICM